MTVLQLFVVSAIVKTAGFEFSAEKHVARNLISLACILLQY